MCGVSRSSKRTADYSIISNPNTLFGQFKTCHFVSGDYNNDGLIDFAITQGDTIEVIVLLGKVDGSFQVSSRYKVGYSFFYFEIYQKDGGTDELIEPTACRF